MRFSLIVMLASAYARISLGGTLEIIDVDNQCAIWSYDNHGCTGSSAFFSRLDGDDCSRLDKVANSTHPGYPMRGAEACGTENNSSAAWLRSKKLGRCTASDLIHSTKSSSTESFSTKSCSTKSSSALTTLDYSSSTMEPSSTTFQTVTISDCS
ncbi:unnamed protein product [Penicillium salamii]|nr:unnamed protein product [Penicillium salamii]